MCVGGGVHICRLKRTAVRFPLLFSVDLNFALYKYKYRILILFRLLNHPSRRPVLTRGAASYPPGLAALSCALTSLRGLRFAWSPLAIASRRPRLAPNPGYCLPARSAAPLSPPPPSPPPCRVPRSIPADRRSLLSPSAGWAGVLGAAERAGRRYPRFGAERRPSSCRMGWRPWSRGACGQMVSPVRSGTPPLPRVSGAGERAA